MTIPLPVPRTSVLVFRQGSEENSPVGESTSPAENGQPSGNGQPSENGLPCWIEESDGTRLVISAPAVPLARLPEPGELLLVRWTTPRGYCEVPAALVSADSDQPPLWKLETRGEVRRVQRRRFARASTIARVIVAVPGAPGGPGAHANPGPSLSPGHLGIEPAEVENPGLSWASRREIAGGKSGVKNGRGSSQRTARGKLIDLSEGGARCWISEVSALGPGAIEPGREVELRFGLDDTILRIVGTVIRSTPANALNPKGDLPEDAAEVVLTFESREPVAGLIRRFVFHHQALARRIAAQEAESG